LQVWWRHRGVISGRWTNGHPFTVRLYGPVRQEPTAHTGARPELIIYDSHLSAWRARSMFTRMPRIGTLTASG
jgi:hypothetical protein